MKFSKIVTFTGNKKNNKLSVLGDINFWIDSKAYNHIENVIKFSFCHWLTIIGKSEYQLIDIN